MDSSTPTLVEDRTSTSTVHHDDSISNTALPRARSHTSLDLKQLDPRSSLPSPSPTLSHQQLPPYSGSGTPHDPYIVRWRPGELENPLNWSGKKKWSIVLASGLATLCVSFGSSVYTGGIEEIANRFDTSLEVVIAGLSVYILGFAVGPLLWAPSSEIWGRRIVFLLTYAPFVLFTIVCGLSRNIETLIIARFLAAFFGATPVNNSGAVVADLFQAKQRALAMSVFAIAPFLGPVIGPIAGGFLPTWQWLFWSTAIFGTVVYGMELFVPETYSPVLLRRLALRLSTETSQSYISEYDLNLDPTVTIVQTLRINMQRPFFMLFRERIVFLFSLYVAVVYAELYLLFGAYPVVFQQDRGWSKEIGGLPFIGLGIGMMIGILINLWVNKKYVRDSDGNGGFLPPEARLPVCCFAGLCLPVGMFWFAWTVQPSVHWIVPVMASVPFGTGMVCSFISITSYLVDVYLQYSASALAANSVLRSILGAVFPLFTPQLFKKLGSNWALTLVAFLSLALAPIPFVFLRYGASIRRKSAFAPDHQEVKHSSGSSEISQGEKELKEMVMESDLRREEEGKA